MRHRLWWYYTSFVVVWFMFALNLSSLCVILAKLRLTYRQPSVGQSRKAGTPVVTTSQQPIPFRFLSSASNGISLSPLPYFNFLPFLSHMDVLISPCTLLEYNITADLTNLKITWESIAVCFVGRSEWKRKREHIAAHAVTRYPQHRNNAAQSTGGRKKNETHVQDLFAISSGQSDATAKLAPTMSAVIRFVSRQVKNVRVLRFYKKV